MRQPLTLMADNATYPLMAPPKNAASLWAMGRHQKSAELLALPHTHLIIYYMRNFCCPTWPLVGSALDRNVALA